MKVFIILYIFDLAFGYDGFGKCGENTEFDHHGSYSICTGKGQVMSGIQFIAQYVCNCKEGYYRVDGNIYSDCVKPEDCIGPPECTGENEERHFYSRFSRCFDGDGFVEYPPLRETVCDCKEGYYREDGTRNGACVKPEDCPPGFACTRENEEINYSGRISLCFSRDVFHSFYPAVHQQACDCKEGYYRVDGELNGTCVKPEDCIGYLDR